MGPRPWAAANRKWAGIFAETPNYRGLGKAVLGKEQFRWHFGPMFYRGRLTDGDVKVLVIGQEGAQDESLGHRSFVGGTGARMQHVLNHLGITRSYLFLNTFVYPIFGQYGERCAAWPRTRDSPIVQHRHAIYDEVLARNDLRLVIAVGAAAKESVVTWIKSRGGTCPDGPADVSHFTPAGVARPAHEGRRRAPPGRRDEGRLDGGHRRRLQARTLGADRRVGRRRPVVAAARSGRHPPAGAAYKYKSDPIPFRDLPFGTMLAARLGAPRRATARTTSASIQLFSDGGHYNGLGDAIQLHVDGAGTSEGYADEPATCPTSRREPTPPTYDRGPSATTGPAAAGRRGRAARGPTSRPSACGHHPSLGWGPIHRGRLRRRLAARAGRPGDRATTCSRAGP